MERKLFTALQGEGADQLNNCLSQQGFRRSQNILYRPTCTTCSACLSSRINVSAFQPSKSQKRTIKRNSHLKRRAISPWATDEQFDLFRRYLEVRHADGGMADMDIHEFGAMIEETPLRSRVIEYADPKTDELIAATLTDVMDDGLSMVYSFYDPRFQQNSLGTYMILDHIEIAREVALHYVYLGYWVPGSPKMEYKTKFQGLQAHIQGEWHQVDDAEQFAQAAHHPLSSAPVAEQVANIQLPDRHPTRG